MGLEMGISGSMSALSLTDVMNHLAEGEIVPFTFEREGPVKLTELDAFMAVDPTLASLHRHYLNARLHHQAARKEHGAESPMADVAADMEDSAWCAMQTRLMELRAQGDLMRLVQKQLWENEQDIVRAKQDEKDRKAMEFYHRMETARLMKEKNKPAVIYEWLIVLMLLERSVRLPFPSYMPERRIAA